MKLEDIKRFKELLSVPSASKQEHLLVKHITGILEKKGYDFTTDALGSIYVTKGNSDSYPLVVAHTDTVHGMDDMVIEEELNPDFNNKMKPSLKAYKKSDGSPTGIGGDDKAGVFICLDLLDKFDDIKVFFPVSEEIGCIGSYESDKEFFNDVAYAIQFDSTEGNTISKSLSGVDLFNQTGPFIDTIEPILIDNGYDMWMAHPFTDLMVLSEEHGFESVNIAAGYYDYHTDDEYVILDDVDNAIRVGSSIISSLGHTNHTLNEVNVDEGAGDDYDDYNDDDMYDSIYGYSHTSDISDDLFIASYDDIEDEYLY